jgi:hypothetical protein
VDTGLAIASYGAGLSTVVAVQAVLRDRTRLRVRASTFFNEQRELWWTRVLIENRGRHPISIFHMAVDHGGLVYGFVDSGLSGESRRLEVGATDRLDFHSPQRPMAIAVQDDFARRWSCEVEDGGLTHWVPERNPQFQYGVPMRRTSPIPTWRTPRRRRLQKRLWFARRRITAGIRRRIRGMRSLEAA